MNKRSIQRLLKSATAEDRFEPGPHQELAKARFYRRLSELSHVIDRETAIENDDLVIKLCGTAKIVNWMSRPGFAAWFMDADTIADKIMSKQAEALRVLSDVMSDSDSVAPADRIKAARTMLELGDSFPNKKSEVRFLDDRLNTMDESTVDRETQKLAGKLDQLELDQSELDQLSAPKERSE